MCDKNDKTCLPRPPLFDGKGWGWYAIAASYRQHGHTNQQKQQVKIARKMNNTTWGFIIRYSVMVCLQFYSVRGFCRFTGWSWRRSEILLTISGWRTFLGRIFFEFGLEIVWVITANLWKGNLRLCKKKSPLATTSCASFQKMYSRLTHQIESSKYWLQPYWTLEVRGLHKWLFQKTHFAEVAQTSNPKLGDIVLPRPSTAWPLNYLLVYHRYPGYPQANA